jgi:hypothetical protein
MSRIKAEIIVIILLCIYAITSFINTPYVSISFTIGIIGLAISAFLTFKFYRYSFYFLSLILLFSIPSLIAFSQTKFYAGVGKFEVNLIPTCLLLYLCFKRRNLIRTWFSENDEFEKEESRKRKILIFKNEFKNYSKEEINRKLNDNLVIEAKEALTELLNSSNN